MPTLTNTLNWPASKEPQKNNAYSNPSGFFGPTKQEYSHSECLCIHLLGSDCGNGFFEVDMLSSMQILGLKF